MSFKLAFAHRFPFTFAQHCRLAGDRYDFLGRTLGTDWRMTCQDEAGANAPMPDIDFRWKLGRADVPQLAVGISTSIDLNRKSWCILFWHWFGLQVGETHCKQRRYCVAHQLKMWFLLVGKLLWHIPLQLQSAFWSLENDILRHGIKRFDMRSCIASPHRGYFTQAGTTDAPVQEDLGVQTNSLDKLPSSHSVLNQREASANLELQFTKC